jgi:hypothetical protein
MGVERRKTNSINRSFCRASEVIKSTFNEAAVTLLRSNQVGLVTICL